MPTQEQVVAAIIRLRPTLRTVFVMAHVLGRSREEIAAALGITQNRVDRRLTKDLYACRKNLEAKGLDL